MQATFNLDQVVQAYTAIRDARLARKKAFEIADLALEEDMNKLKQVMLAQLNQMGGKSVATEHGTIYRTEKVKPSAADWRVVYDWIMTDPERFELLEKRLKATFVKQFMDDNAGAIPPGINVHREFEVAVRRPTSAPSSSSASSED